MVSSIKTYPYFGSVYRVHLFTGSPNMFIGFLLIGISFSWSKFLYLSNTSKNKLLYFMLISVIFISLLLTFSRDILVVMCSILVSYYYFSSFKFTKKINIKYFVIFIFFIILLLSYILLSHFVLSDNNEYAMNNLINGQYIIGTTQPVSIFSLNHDYVIYKSIYYELKIAAVRIFNESNSLGVGAGNFNESLSLLKDRSIYPKNFTSWDPHSTYFGALSEQGILGVVVICIILFSSFIKCHTTIKNSIQINYIDIGFASLFVGISIQAICVDVMNFRHYWFIFALFATSTSLRDKFSKKAAFKR